MNDNEAFEQLTIAVAHLTANVELLTKNVRILFENWQNMNNRLVNIENVFYRRNGNPTAQNFGGPGS